MLTTTRSSLLLVVLQSALLTVEAATAAAIDLPTLRAMRRQAARRTRRMIFNNDGDDVIYHAKKATKEALLAVRTTPLLGSQVDSIFYSNSLCFGDALHRSKVFAPFLCRQAMCKDNILPGLLDKGIEPIAAMVEFGHQHGLEIIWDMRMNDTHDSMFGGYGPYFRPKLKRDHPEYICGTQEKRPPYGTWTSIDYAQPEVRQLCYRFFEEVCQRFDVDGVEMDFFRHACFFKSVAWGGRASEAELEMMTELMRRIRTMTELQGMRRGRPILVALRIPDSVDYCRGIGLDVERWLKEGLVDLLIGTGYFRLNPWSYLVELGHRYDLPVYPCLSESRVRSGNRFGRNSIESYRARALQAWSAGADGIYVFNYFDPRGQLWRELGERQALGTLDKLYFLTVRDGNPERYLVDGRSYRNVPMLTPDTPLPIHPDKPLRVEMVVGDDLGARTAKGTDPVVICHAQLAGASEVVATINGHALPAAKSVDDWLDFPVRQEWVKRGTNIFAFQGRPQARQQNEWDIVYQAGDLPQRPWQKMGFAKDCLAETRDGKLLLADRGSESGTYAYYRCPCPIRPEDETVVEARLKPLSGWSSILIENGEVYEEVQFFPDKVKSRTSGLTYKMNATDRFHTYRIFMKDRDFQVYVDGTLRLDGPGKVTRPALNGRCGVAFGGANSGSVGEALWESVKVQCDAAALLDLALSIRFSK